MFYLYTLLRFSEVAQMSSTHAKKAYFLAGLLLVGIQGTGKSLTAKAIANEWNLPLLRLDIGKLFGGIVGESESRMRQMIQLSEAVSPCVLWIDEIDKADIEFPNDLLLEIDKMEFYVYETQERIVAKHRPIVLITSNNEKELPDAFLRRCFFHYINFPDEATMEKIVGVHYPDLKQALLKEALDVFFDVRKVPGLKKKPSTSELIDWLKLLMADEMSEKILQERDPSKAIPPLYGALIKNEQDVHLLQRLAFMARRKG